MGGAKPGGERTLRAPRPGEEYLRLKGAHKLQASFALAYELVETPDVERGPWKVATRSYRYHIVTEDLGEVVLFHWHPGSGRLFPHLHVGSSQLTPSAVLSHQDHVPSGRVSLEAVIQMLISELGVVAEREDWRDVLVEGDEKFRTWQTWH